MTIELIIEAILYILCIDNWDGMNYIKKNGKWKPSEQILKATMLVKTQSKKKLQEIEKYYRFSFNKFSIHF